LGAVPVTDGGSWEPHKALWLARRPFAEFVIQRANAKGEQCYISMSGEPRVDGRRHLEIGELDTRGPAVAFAL
jgi:hypothetical protein